MGCSTSKNVNSPVKRTKDGWDAVLPKGFAVQMDRSMKSTEVGYIAAIFSANYGNMRMNSQLKTNDPSFRKHPPGESHQNKASKEVGADVSCSRDFSDRNVAGSLRKPWPDLRVGVPTPGVSQSKQVVQLVEAIWSREEPAETINTWELMEGLEDNAELPFSNEEKRFPTGPASHSKGTDQAIQARVNGDRSSAISMPLPISIPGSTASPVPSRATSIGGSAAAPPRANPFTSIRCIEDVDADIAARSRTSSPPLPENSTEILPCRSCADDRTRQTACVAAASCSPLDPVVSTVSSGEDASSFVSREHSDWGAGNLQRALSFKYIFNNDSSNGIALDLCGNESADAQGIQSDTTRSSRDFATCLTGSTEYDGPSFRPSPEFSGAASLKDWLPIFGMLNQRDPVQTGARRSLLGALEGCSNSSAESSWRQCEDVVSNVPNPERVYSIVNKYGGSDNHFPERSFTKGLNCHASNRFSSDTEGSQVFDPEVLEWFQDPSEEWYTVTKLESESESPKDFLHLLTSFGKKSSKSMEVLKTTGMDDTSAAASAEKIVEAGLKDPTVYKLVGGSLSKMHTEEREFPSKRVSSEREIDEERIVLYSTTWESNAKAYEDCTAVKTLLLSLGTSFDERNISVHAEYEQELEMPAMVPTLRLNGRCFVGLDTILQLHRKGMLGALLREAECGEYFRPKTTCLCRGGKFLICPICKGRRKLGASSCRHCSATGLIKCPNCSSS